MCNIIIMSGLQKVNDALNKYNKGKKIQYCLVKESSVLRLCQSSQKCHACGVYELYADYEDACHCIDCNKNLYTCDKCTKNVNNDCCYCDNYTVVCNDCIANIDCCKNRMCKKCFKKTKHDCSACGIFINCGVGCEQLENIQCDVHCCSGNKCDVPGYCYKCCKSNLTECEECTVEMCKKCMVNNVCDDCHN
jgi:hypothetical protein